MTKAPRLARGDTLAILSPSWGGPAAFPEAYEAGLRVLREDFGFRIREYPTARMPAAELYARPELRAADLNAAFADSEVAGILASIGGNDSVRILPHLDLDQIRANPKFIMGYSDSTSFLAYLSAQGLPAFYGPSVMAGFAYLGNFPGAREKLEAFLFGGGPCELRPFGSWSEEYRDWALAENRGKVGEIRRDDVGHRWLNKGPASRGRLWGGCLEILEMMNGTFAWPERDFWEGRILFLESSEEKPTPAHIGYLLRNFGLQGILERISGLLFARPKAYSAQEKAELEAWIRKVAVGEFGRSDLTIVANLDLGHTDPRHILPYGVELGIDPAAETLRFTEDAFAEEPRC